MEAILAEKQKMDIDEIVVTVYTQTDNKTTVGGIDMSEALNRARNKYDAINAVHFHLKLNKNTDADILDKLNRVASKQGYIKELIRRDLKQAAE